MGRLKTPETRGCSKLLQSCIARDFVEAWAMFVATITLVGRDRGNINDRVGDNAVLHRLFLHHLEYI